MRRSLLLLSVVLLLLTGNTSIAGADETPDLLPEVEEAVDSIVASDVEPAVKVTELLDLQARYPDTYSSSLHNALRHLYSDSDPDKSLQQCDILLENAVMDTYIVSILSDWQLDKNRQKAIVQLLTVAKKAKAYKHVQAACWLQVGDLYRQSGDYAAARLHYKKVLKSDEPAIALYQVEAKLRLKYVK